MRQQPIWRGWSGDLFAGAGANWLNGLRGKGQLPGLLSVQPMIHIGECFMRKKFNNSAFDAEIVVVLDIETIVPDQQPDECGFPKWPRHQPVVASLLTAMAVGQGKWRFQLDNLQMTQGGEGAFYDTLNSRLPKDGLLLTANGRGFDMPALALGAMAARRFELSTLSELSRANRYDAVHTDICELFSNYGGAPKPALAEICAVLGIPVKVDTHGSEVGDLVAAGDIERVKRYCASDVAATYVAWLHWSAMRTADDAAIAEPLSCFARWIASGPGLDHLLPIANCEVAAWARERAIQLRLKDAHGEAYRRKHLRLAGNYAGRGIAGYIDALPAAPLGF